MIEKALFLAMLLVVLPMVTYAQDITTCTNLNSSNTTYNLINSISANYNNGFNITVGSYTYYYCLWINENNIVLDCHENAITATQTHGHSGIFINSTLNNITIRNCVINGTIANASWQYGDLYMDSINNSLFENIDLSDGLGFYLKHSYNNFLSNITLTYPSGSWFLYLFQSSNNIITNFTELTNPNNGLLFYYSNNNTFYNNVFTMSNMYDVSLDGNSFNNSFYNNKFSTATNPQSNYFNTTKQTGTRIYGNGIQIGGNWWDGYSETCTDANDTGFCDIPYNISGSYDYLPLSNQYGCYWSYTNWSICTNYNQTRNYTNHCGNDTMEYQSCQCSPDLSNITYSSCINYTKNMTITGSCGNTTIINQSCYSGNTSLNYCYDNNTLMENSIYIYDGNQHNLSEPITCHNGCDNITNSCNPLVYQENIIEFIVIGAVVIFGVLILSRVKRR